ncbi:MAG TPA: SBBP repeat-containing protein [Polyangiaceae bacterium]|nr:SBBP repeat-containing protein [Polyangiaceae bacterium]
MENTRPFGALRALTARRPVVALGFLAAACGLAAHQSRDWGPPPAAAAHGPLTTPSTPGSERASGQFGGVPVAFEENLGQAGGDVRFIARGGSSSLLLAKNEAVFTLEGAANEASAPARPDHAKPRPRRTSLRMTLAHPSPAAEIVGEGELPGRANYLIGNDPEKWKRDVPRFERVRMRGVYEGVDVVYYGGESHALEYDFVVKRRADPRQITLAFNDADGVTRGPSGELLVTTGASTVTMKAPVSYQLVDGARRAVETHYVVEGKTAALRVGAYDPDLELVVDPVVHFSTYFGGSGTDRITCLARDPAGNLYMAGSTTSPNLPAIGTIPGGADLGGRIDAFVTKLNPTGSQVLYSTYLGGSSDEYQTDEFNGFITGPRNCAVDAQGRLHVSTTTVSTDFPTTAGAFSRVHAGAYDVTLSRLSPAGNALEFSTFLGGASSEYWATIALDPTGHIWMAGHTHSLDFPVQRPTQATKASPATNDADTFVARVRPDGSGLAFSTYLGGAGRDYPFDIAVDAASSAYVVGVTSSRLFPTTPGTLQPVFGGAGNGGLTLGDAFITKFRLLTAGADDVFIGYSTYLGGSADEMGQAIALGADGSAYVGGVTTSVDFPGQTGRPGSATSLFDGFVAKLDPTGSTLRYSRLFGDEKTDGVYALAVNAAGNLFVAGVGSPARTTVNGCGRPSDKGLLGMLNPTGTAWEYLTTFGQENTQIVIDDQDNAYIAGWGETASIPIVGTVAQPSYGGGQSDGYLLKMAKLPNTVAPGCLGCTGDFGGSGPRACAAATPKCLLSGVCGNQGDCSVDAECGGATSGRICEPKVSTKCIDGCRGVDGNGCPAGLVCTSKTAVAGTCAPPQADAGAPDGAVPPTPVPTGTTPTPAPTGSVVSDGGNPCGTVEGGGCSTSGSSTPTSALLLAAGVAAAIAGRRRTRR